MITTDLGPADRKFSFCESVYAGPKSPWHIRRLTDIGRKLGGGADSLALCGRKVAWDLKIPLTKHHLSHSCLECVNKLPKLDIPNK